MVLAYLLNSTAIGKISIHARARLLHHQTLLILRVRSVIQPIRSQTHQES
jgi:hypothetical protein